MVGCSQGFSLLVVFLFVGVPFYSLPLFLPRRLSVFHRVSWFHFIYHTLEFPIAPIAFGVFLFIVNRSCDMVFIIPCSCKESPFSTGDAFS